jgi:serine/threonine protein kinase
MGEGHVSASEDLDLGITQTFGDRGFLGHLARRSRVRRADDAEARLPTSQASTIEPRMIAGYELVRRLGRGGMAIVYEARRMATGEHVALKAIDPSACGADESLRREVRALTRLDHPNVVRLRQSAIRRREPFFTMDLLPGPNLAAVLAQGLPKLLTILRRIAKALAFVHARGIVHRDLTPSNVLFRAPDEPVLVDFGLATPLPSSAAQEPRKAGCKIVGTLAYMAPEQIRGQPVDARTDLYAFGCILYEALAGRVPFAGNHRATVLRQHLEATPCPPSLFARGIPAAVEDLALRLLAKTPRERVGSAVEVVAALDALGAGGWTSR